MGKAHDLKNSDQMAMVRRGECPFEVKITEDNALPVGVSIFHIEA